MSARRQTLFWIALAAMTALLIAAGGEILARLFSVKPYQRINPANTTWAKPHPDLGWVNNPGVHRVHEKGHTPMTIWPDGRRATRADPAPPAAASRDLILIGCSVTEGFSVRDDQSFAWLLQAADPTLAVSNYGCPGYGTYQSLLGLERIIGERKPSRPFAVVYGFLSMHADRNVANYTFLEALRTFGGERFAPPHALMANGSLTRYPPLVLKDWPFESRSALVSFLHGVFLRRQLAGRDTQRIPVTLALLGEMAALVRKHGGRFVVAVLWDDPKARQYLDFLKSAGMESVDCSYRGPVNDVSKLFVEINGHPNRILHAWWADCLTGWLKASF